MIYLDHNATTPVDPLVREVMVAVLAAGPGNPSSIHAAGRAARGAVEQARRQVARLMGVEAAEIVFTSGGTEADNLAIVGLARAARAAGRGTHLVTSQVEHSAVLSSCRALEREGFAVTYLPVDERGWLQVEQVREALRADTVLVSLAAANNETGNLADLAALVEVAHRQGIPLHTDAVQLAGKRPLDLRTLGVDLASLSAHKLQGPAGAGALYVRRGLALELLSHGGHQERGRRGGTENVAGLVGLGLACELARQRMAGEASRSEALGRELERGLLALPGARLNGEPERRLRSTVNVSFEGVDGETLLVALDLEGVCVSTGSACTSGSVEPSHVLRAMGRSTIEARGAVRFSLGRSTTAAEIEAVLGLLPRLLERIRAASAG